MKSPKRTIEALSRLTFNENKSYVIIGGTKDIGLEMSDWMIKRGAKKIFLNAAKSNLNGFQLLCLKRWSYYTDVVVQISNEDIATTDGAKNLILAANRLGPVGGKYSIKFGQI